MQQPEIGFDTYGAYLDMREEEFSTEKGLITDRFIPTRKYLRR